MKDETSLNPLYFEDKEVTQKVQENVEISRDYEIQAEINQLVDVHVEEVDIENIMDVGKLQKKLQ